jgi:predicted metal-dependent peptidase
MTTTTFDINKHLHKLLRAEPFFAAISRRINKIPTTAIPTAGVRLNPESAQFEMVYNVDFFNRLVEDQATYLEGLKVRERKVFSDKHRLDDGTVDPYVFIRGVILHELFHIVFGHVTHRLPEGGMTKRWNISTDLAINSNIADMLPPVALIPGQGVFADMPLGRSADWYMKNLPEGEGEDEGGEGDEGGEEGEGEGGEGGDSGSTLDDHTGWGGDIPDDVREMAEERARQIVTEAVSEGNSRGWGSVDHGTRNKIIDSIRTVVNWRAVLRAFVKRSQRADRRSTVRRLDRRQPYIWSGKRVNRQAQIAISIDQSGSVSDSLLTAFFSELDKLAKLAEFTVIPFDDRVAEDKVYVWKKGEARKAERVLCGGTNFDPPTQYVNKNGFDGHIVLTDMMAPKPVPSKCQRMWMTSAQHAANPYFQTNEKVISIEDR